MKIAGMRDENPFKIYLYDKLTTFGIISDESQLFSFVSKNLVSVAILSYIHSFLSSFFCIKSKSSFLYM